MNLIPLGPMAPRPLARRDFLSRCAGCAAWATCAAMVPRPATARIDPPSPSGRPRVRLVFSHRPPSIATWPHQDYDYEARKAQIARQLEASCPGVDFLPATAQNNDDARKILEADHEVDGYLVYLIGLWTGAPRTIASSLRPTLLVDDLYAGSGEFLIAYAGAKRQGWRVAGVSSSRFEDVAEAVRVFPVLQKLRSSVILDVTDRDPAAAAAAIKESFGSTVRQVSSKEIDEAYRRADRHEGKKWAQRWIRSARKVVEPTTAEIEDAGVMWVALRDLMAEHSSPAITVDCLNLFYAGKMPAYPCMGFFQLLDENKVGACEGDLQSTITMLAMQLLTGRPGYISDPVIDTARNQVIYAHCVAPSRVFGPEGSRNPYWIRSHSEDRKGVSVRSILPVGEMTTTLKFNPVSRQVIFHQGRSVANIDDDKACRTKLAVSVRDPYRLMSEWDRWGWHRVTFYGDLRRPLEVLSGMLGFQVVEEG